MDDERQIGGKAAGLEALVGAGATVPNFVVVDGASFRQHLQRCGLSALIERALGDLRPEQEDLVSAAERVGDEIREALLATSLGDGLRGHIGELLEQLGEGPLAVRSSMVGEDSAGASFAGQLESVLYCRGLAEVEHALLGCWASAFSGRVLAYRLRHEERLHTPSMGVVVQRMISGDVSGVVFTAHPVTGRRDQGLITAAWGLGEGVVSGVCNTDEYTWQHGGQEVAAAIADKDLELLPLAPDQPGTREVEVAEDRRRERCLDPAEVGLLGSVSEQIAADFGCPMDIEWTRAEGTFWILQARPITSLPEPPNVDGPVQVFDNSNIQESYCGVTSPLTFSFASEAYASVYEQTMRAVRLPEPVIAQHRGLLRNLLGLVRGRVYYNIGNWYRGLLLLPSFGRNKEDMEAMMGLEDPVDLVEGEELSLLQKLQRLPSLLRTLLALQSQFRRLPRSVAGFLADFEQSYQEVDRAELGAATYSRCMELLEHLRSRMLDRWHVPIINDFYVMMTTGTLRRALGERSDELFTQLLSGEEGIESTEPTKMLLRMAAEGRAKPELAEAIRQAARAEVPVLPQGRFPGFEAQIADYIERYGDRCMGELKLETTSLREDPRFVFDVLVSFLGREDLDADDLARREQELRASGEASVRAHYGPLARWRIARALSRARDSVKNRENMRLARTRMFGLYRDVYRRIGGVLAEAGRLDEERDVFYLTTEELRAYHEGRSVNADLASIARVRRAEFEAYEQEDLPHQFTTVGPVYFGNRYAGPERPAVDGDARVLEGTGCYPGVVEAPLRVILSPKDSLDVGGKILCTVRTDPGWAPLFPSSSGILVERGSTLSHSAVVARELGIPAVVGVPGLLEIVEDGEPVRLDGATGLVERLRADSSSAAFEHPQQESEGEGEG